MTDRQSDSSIVLGGGRADHMGKGRAKRLNEQGDHVLGRIVPKQSVSRTLLELREKARREPKYRFRSLYREIDLSMLHASFRDLKRRAAPGVDGVTVKDYEVDLDNNLRQLLTRLVNKTYRSQKVRRKLIPKGGGKTRPLGIPALEDKIVQQAANKLLQAIFEVNFLDASHGYRPKRGARNASQLLREQLFCGRVNWIVEADIKGFFDHVDHNWLCQMLEQRVDDQAFIRLIRKWLKAGVLEESGEVIHPVTGTPQGGIISPILANIYLHYVLDLWMDKIVPKKIRGAKVYMRYADDFIVGFEHKADAEWFYQELPKRLAKFGLSIAEDKSGILRFSRFDLKGSKCFTFLGLEFYWAKTRKGKRTIKRRTSKKKFRSSLKNLKEWMNKNCFRPLKKIAYTLKRKFQGYLNYYGVIGNSPSLWRYWNESQRIIYRSLNRRSQRRSYNWTGFNQMWKTLNIPNPRIVERPLVRHQQLTLFNS